MPATPSRLPVELKRRVRRSRRALLRRLPKSAKHRLRFAKWAVVGPPQGVVAGKVPGSSAAKPPARTAVPGKPTKVPKPQAAVLGSVEAGPMPVPAGKSLIQIRREFVFASMDPATVSVLEVGPAHNPIAPKREGFKTKNVDHLDRAGLVEKYRTHENVPTDLIEDVDYVIVPGADMAAGIDERFDVILASHVIEHSTSLIDFINEWGRLLNEGGTLALIVPDKRFCFDRFRERSSLSAVVDASLRVTAVHTQGTLSEHALYAANRQGRISWPPGSTSAYGLVHDLAYAKELVAQAKSGDYIDVHHWVFTPNHLRLLLQDLADLGHIALRESAFHNTVGFEFFLKLTADGPGPDIPRRRLLELADAERRSLDVPVFESA